MRFWIDCFIIQKSFRWLVLLIVQKTWSSPIRKQKNSHRTGNILLVILVNFKLTSLIISWSKHKHLVFLCLSNEDILFCPVCHSAMKPYDRITRIMKQYNKETEYLILSRYRCTNKGCNKVHILLPDLLLPHKHNWSRISAFYDRDVLFHWCIF